MVLADTSIWIDHLRIGDEHLAGLLRDEQVVCHPFVVGELACGNIKNRQEILSLVSSLPVLEVVTSQEALVFIDRHQLMRTGLGLIDVHLLASCALGSVLLWTGDKPLARAAARQGFAYKR